MSDTLERLRKVTPMPNHREFTTVRIDLLQAASKDIFDLESKLDSAERQAKGWEESAAHFAKGQEFYQGLVRQIGEPFGAPAYTSDDGSVQQDVLALKVPELVNELRSRLDALTTWIENHHGIDVPDLLSKLVVENQRHLTVDEQRGMHEALRKSVTLRCDNTPCALDDGHAGECCSYRPLDE